MDVFLAQLLALRAAIDALLATMEGLNHEPQETGPIGCQHTEIENVGTFGAPAYRCAACHQNVARPA